MSYSKQHYILHEQEIYTNTGQRVNLLHSESQAEAEGILDWLRQISFS